MMSDLAPSEQDYADAREHLIDILVAVQNTTVPAPRVPTVRGPIFREAVAQIYAREIDALCESAWQPAEMDALNRRMADLLTRTANALNGDPQPPVLAWSWHNLPELAARLKATQTRIAGQT